MKAVSPIPKLLLGPGPSEVHSSVYQALASPVLSQMDPDLWAIMDETVELLRDTFQTSNPLTFPLPGTGMAGMEAAVSNVLEPGDTFVVGSGGFFADRIAEVAARSGANVVKVDVEWGRSVEPEALEARLKELGDVKAVAVVHCETSTGVLQPLGDLAAIAHARDALLIVDTVASLGGVDVPVDTLGIDVAYSGSQKCLGCVPGLSMVTLSERAAEVVETRKTLPTSWYLDIGLLMDYWITGRKYHHTTASSLTYALHQALRLVLGEGLAAVFARHEANSRALRSGVDAMGLSMAASEEVQSPTVHAVLMPEGVDSNEVRRALMDEHRIETGGGLGVFAGKAIRIGLMGHSSRLANVLSVLSALEKVLDGMGYEIAASAGVEAAQRSWMSETG